MGGVEGVEGVISEWKLQAKLHTGGIYTLETEGMKGRKWVIKMEGAGIKGQHV